MNLKVYEYAKQRGVETLSLMDKIREWKLPVKSHMAELTPELIRDIDERLAQGEKGEPADAKKTAKRKVARKTAKPAEKKEPKVVKKSKPKDEPAEEATEEKPKRRTTAKTVIRRRASDMSQDGEGLTEQEIQASAVANSEDTSETAASAVTAANSGSVNTTAPVQEAILENEDLEMSANATSVSAIPSTTEVSPIPEVRDEVAAVAPPIEEAPKESSADEESRHAVPGRKREVLMTPRGPTSGVRSEAVPRSNIVGRMDLSRVSPGGAGRGPAARPHSTGPRNIRTGFVAQPISTPPVFQEQEDSRRKFDPKKKLRGPAAPAAAAGAGREQAEVEVFSATEFRKREMVFQPKKKRGVLTREALKTEITTPKASKRVLRVNQSISVGELAQAMGVKAPQVIKLLMNNSIVATMNTPVDFDTAALLAPEFGFEAVNVHQSVDERLKGLVFGDVDAELVLRAPVVTVMGHVDHGKTTLLDAIRNADVAAREAGGITQHIGAYRVKLPDGKYITFIDTPGHEAFTAMRARGANATDIAIIVVAADDGVMPQTVEAINHAKAADVPIIVAVNKMDRPNANVKRIQQELTEHELVPEEWGGNTIFCPVSALQKTGISELLEQIKVVAEVLELKANPQRSATGVVIEARLERGRGPVATLLVQDGTIEIGQHLVAGAVRGRVRSMMNDRGEQLKSAGPSEPVELLGLDETPLAGDRFDVVKDEATADQIARLRKEEITKLAETPNSKMSLDAIFSKLQQGELKELPIVLKTDVAGSVEAIRGMFDKLSTPEVRIKLIHSAVGGISESDVLLASTAKGMLIGFNVRPDGGATAMAKQQGVEIKTYTIVYELIDDMKKAMQGLLAPEVVEKTLGRAEVRDIFTVPKVGTIAGCAVVDGRVSRSSRLRLVRDGRVVYQGNVSSLKRFKDDVKEVASGYECGIGIENFNDIKVGDVIEAFVEESIAREI